RRINTLCNRLLLAGFLGGKHAFDTADVQAIAREIREELGPEATLATVPAARETAAATTNIATIDSTAWLAHFRDIEERLDRLDKTVGSAIRLLQRLLQPERVGKQPGAPMGR
ncbi:MAG TPA: hypothetical protein VIF33_04355, partial [Casimicrobiaceae bacterium]